MLALSLMISGIYYAKSYAGRLYVSRLMVGSHEAKEEIPCDGHAART